MQRLQTRRLFVGAGLAVLASCATAAAPDTIIGIWRIENSPVTYAFTDEGEVSIQRNSRTDSWEVQPIDQIRWRWRRVREGAYRITGSPRGMQPTMQATIEDGEMTLTSADGSWRLSRPSP